LEHILRERADGHGIALDLGRQVVSLVPRERDGERHLEQGKNDEREDDVACEKAPGHGRATSRSPMPRTVSIQPGSPSFFRSEATWTSTVFVGPNHSVFQTSRSMWSRLTTAPG